MFFGSWLETTFLLLSTIDKMKDNNVHRVKAKKAQLINENLCSWFTSV